MNIATNNHCSIIYDIKPTAKKTSEIRISHTNVPVLDFLSVDAVLAMAAAPALSGILAGEGCISQQIQVPIYHRESIVENRIS